MRIPFFVKREMMKRKKIEEIYEKFHSPEFLTSDPLLVVHRYRSSDMLPEIALLSALLSYGRVSQIIKAIESVLQLTDDLSSEFLVSTSNNDILGLLSEFKYRFHTGKDIALLLIVLKDIRSEYGSLTDLTKELWERSSSGELLFENFTQEFKMRAINYPELHEPSFDWLFPSPSKGSPCKRIAMYFRWMVREDDGIDLALWQFIPTSELTIQVDTHVARVSKELGLTKRRGTSWKMAREITDNLQKLCSKDPVRYDFSLCRAGMFE